MFCLFLATCLLLAFLRFMVKGHDAIFDQVNLLKTFAHFFLGGMLGYVWATGSPWPLIPFMLLTIIELIAFRISGAKILFKRD